jgi:hypothetical protein
MPMRAGHKMARNLRAVVSNPARSLRVPLCSAVLDEDLVLLLVLVMGSAKMVAAGNSCLEVSRTWDVIVAFGSTSVTYPCALVSVVEESMVRIWAVKNCQES